MKRAHAWPQCLVLREKSCQANARCAPPALPKYGSSRNDVRLLSNHFRRSVASAIAGRPAPASNHLRAFSGARADGCGRRQLSATTATAIASIHDTTADPRAAFESLGRQPPGRRSRWQCSSAAAADAVAWIGEWRTASPTYSELALDAVTAGQVAWRSSTRRARGGAPRRRGAAGRLAGGPLGPHLREPPARGPPTSVVTLVQPR